MKIMVVAGEKYAQSEREIWYSYKKFSLGNKLDILAHTCGVNFSKRVFFLIWLRFFFKFSKIFNSAPTNKFSLTRWYVGIQVDNDTKIKTASLSNKFLVWYGKDFS